MMKNHYLLMKWCLNALIDENEDLVYFSEQDGKNNITMKIQVDVQDVQDKPPRFTNAPRATISENVRQVINWA